MYGQSLRAAMLIEEGAARAGWESVTIVAVS